MAGSVDDLHDCTPDDAIAAIVIWVPIGITQKSSPRRIHPGNYQWKNSGMDGNNPDAGNGFALELSAVVIIQRMLTSDLWR